MPSATQFLHITEPLLMKKGGRLPAFTLAYETWGQLNDGSLQCGINFKWSITQRTRGIQQSRPSPGWWETMIGPGAPIDTERFHVIALNSLGSCKGSTGPASVNPETGKPYRLKLSGPVRRGHRTKRPHAHLRTWVSSNYVPWSVRPWVA